MKIKCALKINKITANKKDISQKRINKLLKSRSNYLLNETGRITRNTKYVK